MRRIVCEWDIAGIEATQACASVFVIVDVLSFSTTVSVAVDRGASVIPFPYGDHAAASLEAELRDASLASSRGTAGGKISLSPVSMKQLEWGARILLPSLNGSRLSLATGGTPTISGCLRNARAAARLADSIAGEDGTIAVIAAGERWPDGTLRPAIEDLLGAGAIIEASDAWRNADAELAATAFSTARERIPHLIRTSRSGCELVDRGFGDDVEVALQIGVSTLAPIMTDGAYMALRGRSI